MFGWISVAIGAAAAITSGIRSSQAASAQADQARYQAQVLAQQRRVQGAQEVGNLELGLAMSGVKYDTAAGMEESELIAAGGDATLDAESMDTASMILAQSRINIERDVGTILETGETEAINYEQTGQSGLLSSIFGTASNVLGYGSWSAGQARSSNMGYGEWLMRPFGGA